MSVGRVAVVSPEVSADAVELADLARDEVGLVALGHAGKVSDRIADRVVGPQPLGLALAIVLNDRVGRREDGLSRAVILFELENLRGRIVALEVEDVADIGAPPAINRLVLVTDDAEISAQRRECLHQQILDAIGILVLVDQQVMRAPLPTRERFRIVAQEAIGLQQ